MSVIQWEPRGESIPGRAFIYEMDHSITALHFLKWGYLMKEHFSKMEVRWLGDSKMWKIKRSFGDRFLKRRVNGVPEDIVLLVRNDFKKKKICSPCLPPIRNNCTTSHLFHKTTELGNIWSLWKQNLVIGGQKSQTWCGMNVIHFKSSR